MGELITRVSVWAALAAYAMALVRFSGGRPTDDGVARWWWTAGCASYLAHVVAAFGAFYSWSHAVAIDETLRQTEELAGVRSGSGLYFNYLFTLVWVVDVVYWWRAGLERYRERAMPWHVLVQGFFFFMVVNGAVIFVSGPARWFGGAICVLAGVALLRIRIPGIGRRRLAD